MNKINKYRPSTLVVDTDEKIIELFRATLKQRNYRFYSAKTYNSAIDHLSIKGLDLLVVELNLEDREHHGLKLAIEAKKLDVNIQIIIITENPDANSIKEAAEIDVYDYLQKPIQSVAILRSSSRAIEKRLLLNERDELKRHLDSINLKLEDSRQVYLKFMQEYQEGRFEVEEKLGAGLSELKKAVENIKPGVEKDGE